MLSIKTEVSKRAEFPAIIVDVLVDLRPALFPRDRYKNTSDIETFSGDNIVQGVIIKSGNVSGCPYLIL